MANKTILIFLTLFSVFFSQGTVWAIQALTDTEMDDVTGQAGVSIFITTTMVTHNRSTFIVYDTKGGTIEFTPFNTTLVAATRNKTLDLDVLNYNDDYFGTSTTFTDTWLGGSETRTIQHALNDHVYVNASIENMYLNINSTIDDVLFNGVSLGPLELANMQVAGADLNVFQYDGMGIDATFKTQFNIEKFVYRYDNESLIDRKYELQVKNLAVAGSFGGVPLPSYKDTVNPGGLINTAAWTPQDYFRFGDMAPAWSFTFVDNPDIQDPFPTATVNSLSIDFKEDTSPWVRRQYIIDWEGNYNPDPDGLMGSSDATRVANVRANSVYVEVGLPTRGSIRLGDVGTRITAGGPPTEISFGPAAIDGIRGYSRIEAPGYGIGNSPTTSKLYE